MRKTKPEPLETDLSLEKTLYGKPTPEFLAELRAKYESLKADLSSFGAEFDQAEARLASFTRDKFPALLDHIETLTAERDALGQKWGVDLVAMAKERNEWAERAENAEAELASLRETHRRAMNELLSRNATTEAELYFARKQVDTLTAELAAERGRREAAEAKLAQVMAALETVERWWNDGNGTSLAPECMAGITSVIAAALAGADAVPSCGGERIELLERIAKAANHCLNVMAEFEDYPSAWGEALEELDGLVAKLDPREVLPEPEKP